MAKAVIYNAGFLEKKKNGTVANYIKREAKTDIFNLKDLNKLNLEMYDTIIFGTANHGGKPEQPIFDFVNENKGVLDSKKVYLYILCGSDNEKNTEQVEAIKEALGISNAVCFFKNSEEKNESGLPAEIDAFIKSL